MPKNKEFISQFNYGIIRNADVKDIPINAASDSQNIESISESGLLKGIPAATSVSGISTSIKKSVWLAKSDGKKTLVYWDGSQIRVIEDFYGSKSTTATGLYSAYPPAMVASNNRVYIGTGVDTYEVGYRVNSQFATSVITNHADRDYIEIEGIPDSSAIYIVNVDSVGTTEFTNKIVQEYNGKVAIVHTAHGITGVGSSLTIKTTFNLTQAKTTVSGYVTEIPNSNLIVTSIDWDPPTNIPNGTRRFDILYNTTIDYTLFLSTGNFTITQTSPTSQVIKSGTIDNQKFYLLLNGLTIRFSQKEGYAINQNWQITTVLNASESLYYTDAKLTCIKDSIISMTSEFMDSGSTFSENKSYFYAYSYTYNNLEESPLAVDYAYKFHPGGDYAKNIITFSLNSSLIDDRVTGINIYQASGNSESLSPDEEYRLIASMSMVGGAWRGSGATKTTKLVDTGLKRTTYQENTGISETESDVHVGYRLSAVINNELFVGHCFQERLSTDSVNMLFKSKPFRYNVFDWSIEYLKLPDTPIAMVGFEGRLYVFMKNVVYRINPDGLFVEDIYEDIGIINQDALVVTDSGLYWSDDFNAYAMSQGKIEPISFPISYDDTWHGLAYNYHFVGFDASRYAILYCFAGSTTITVWAYNISFQRWDKYSLPITNAYSIFGGKESELYIGTNSSIKELFSSASDLAWYWESKEIDLGDSIQDKVFYKIEANNEGTVVIYYSIDGESYTSIASGGSIQSAGAWREGSKIKIKLDCPSGVGKTRGLRIVYRNKIGVL